LADIETILLQASETYKEQIERDMYSIADKLQTMIHGNRKRQTYHIQRLLADELDSCKEKEKVQVKEYI